MAFKSEAQRKKLYELLKAGKISQGVIDEFEKASQGKKLPDRVPRPTPKAKTKPWFVKVIK